MAARTWPLPVAEGSRIKNQDSSCNRRKPRSVDGIPILTLLSAQLPQEQNAHQQRDGIESCKKEERVWERNESVLALPFS